MKSVLEERIDTSEKKPKEYHPKQEVDIRTTIEGIYGIDEKGNLVLDSYSR